MDSIFWGVYLADIVSAIKTAAFVSICLTSLGLWILIGMKSDNIDVPRWQIVTLAVIFVVSAIFNVFTPSKQAIYVMLGVKTTDTLLEQPVAQKAIKLLEEKIDKELANTKKEDEYLNKEEINEFWKNLDKKVWGVLGLFVLFTIFLNIVIPNKATMYAMVASEAVSRSVDSDIVKKAINRIDQEYNSESSK